MPTLAVNTRLLLPGRIEGISRFAYEVLTRMVKRHPEVTFHFLFDRPYAKEMVFGSNVIPHHVPPPARHPVLWYAWFHISTRLKLARLSPDAYFSPELYHSFHPGIPQLPVFHDLGYEHFPEDVTGSHGRYFRHYSRKYAQAAHHLFTVSEYSKQDIVDTYGILPEKITVVHNGAGSGFQPISSPEEKQAIRDRYTAGKPYFYFVGTLQPRKNVHSLLKAFDRFRSQVEEDWQLLIVGRKGWKYAEAEQAYEQMTYREAVQFTGFVPDDALKKIGAASEGLVYLPRFEGFGIPLLEALHMEVPVISSNLTAMPEVVGDAALLVDPYDIDAVAKCMARLAHSPELRHELVAKGRLQRANFSWDKTYERVWGELEKWL